MESTNHKIRFNVNSVYQVVIVIPVTVIQLYPGQQHVVQVYYYLVYGGEYHQVSVGHYANARSIV